MLSGEEEPLQGTNFRISLKVCSCSLAEEEMQFRRSFSLKYILRQLAEVLESHSMRIALQFMKCNDLINWPLVFETW